jgi:hypothetical protein
MGDPSNLLLRISTRMAAVLAARVIDGSDRDCESDDKGGYGQRHQTTAALRTRLWLPQTSGGFFLIVKRFGLGQTRAGHLTPIFDCLDWSLFGVDLPKSLFNACRYRSFGRLPAASGFGITALPSCAGLVGTASVACSRSE